MTLFLISSTIEAGLWGGMEMANGKHSIVVEGNLKDSIEQAKKWVAHIEREIAKMDRNRRTRGLILLGAALVEGLNEEEKNSVYERFLEREAMLRSAVSTSQEKNSARGKNTTDILSLARRMAQRLRGEVEGEGGISPVKSADGEVADGSGAVGDHARNASGRVNTSGRK
jgi:hypothetical protein